MNISPLNPQNAVAPVQSSPPSSDEPATPDEIKAPAAASPLSAADGQSAGDQREENSLENKQDQVPTSNSQEKVPVDENQVTQAVEQLNDFMKSQARELEFEFKKDLGRTIITVRDASTDEIVRQLPPETALEMAEKLQDLDPKGPTDGFDGELGILLNERI